MKKKIFSLSLVMSAFLAGCGTTSDDNTSSAPLILSVLASDAYVAKLNTPATLKIGDKEYNTTDVENGKVKFKVPKDINLSQDVKVLIPADAIVDSNNNGKYDSNDTKIRMPLETNSIGDGYVANPLTTAALETNNTDLLKKVKKFDPVEAKKELILNPDDNQTKVLVAASDGIAVLSQKVEEKGKNPLVAMKEINTSAIEEAYKNPSDVNITDVLNKALSPAANYGGVDLSSVIDKVDGIMKVIDKASISVKNIKGNGNTINVDEVANAYTSLVIATSDGNISSESVINNFGNIENSLLQHSDEDINAQEIINQINNEGINGLIFPPTPGQTNQNNTNNQGNNGLVYPPAPGHNTIGENNSSYEENHNYDQNNGENEGGIDSIYDFKNYLSTHNLTPINYDLTNKAVLIGEGWKLLFEDGKVKDSFWSFDTHSANEHNLEEKDNIYIKKSDFVSEYDTYFAIIEKSNPMKVAIKEGQSVKLKDGIVLNIDDLNKTVNDISDVKTVLQNNGINTVTLNINVKGTSWIPIEKPFNIYQFNEDGTGIFNHKDDKGDYNVSSDGISAISTYNGENEFKVYILPASIISDNEMKVYTIFVDAKYNKIVGGEVLTLKRK